MHLELMDNKNIEFDLVIITTEQFAIIESNYEKDAEIKVNLDFRFVADKGQKLVAVFNTFTFSTNEKQFLLIEAGCHFSISDDWWGKIYNEKENKVIVEKEALQQMVAITIGTTRGILHGKTEHTQFNQHFIPVIYVDALITEKSEFKLL